MIAMTFVKKAFNFAVFRVPYLAARVVAPGPAEHVRVVSSLLSNIGVLYHRVRLLNENVEALNATRDDLPRIREDHEHHLRVHQEAITELQKRVAELETKAARVGQSVEHMDVMIQRDLGLRYLQLVGLDPQSQPTRRDVEGGKR